MNGLARTAVACLTLWVGACDAGSQLETGTGFFLKAILPKEREGVLLNEPLDLYFSGDIDRSSVTYGMRVIGEDGERARGEISVEGDHLRFMPAPGLDFDLTDGGFRLDRSYEIELLGYPCPDGLRSVDGELLDRTYRWSLHTVARGEGTSFFGDDSPGEAGPLQPLTQVVGPEGPLVFLSLEEPIDPTSVFNEDFLLFDASNRRVALTARLRREVDERELEPRMLSFLKREPMGRRSVDPHRSSLLELRPGETWAPGAYRLYWREPRLCDFGGNRMSILTEGGRPPFEFQVIEEVHVEDFADPGMRSPIPVPGTDGTAHWSDRGQVSIRFPAAAGDGSDGAVVLGAEESRRDISATRLELPAGEICRLAETDGLVVLRSQGRMVISGDLVRPGTPAAKLESERAAFDGRKLSDWLETVQSDPTGWTVLIAGGDLVIEGSLRTDHPLLLVAGGLVRVPGRVDVPKWKRYLLDEGGGPGLDVNTKIARLTIDPPLKNPLRESLRFGVLSGPIPVHGGVRSWLPPRVEGRHNFGCYRVRYADKALPLDDGALVPMGGPNELEGALRMVIELEVFPPGHPDVLGELWNPPFIDYVRLSWY